MSRVASRRLRPASAARGVRVAAGFVRVIYPDPGDFLGVTVGDKTLWAMPRSSQFPRLSDDSICFGLLTRGTSSAACRTRAETFARSPLNLSWGFSGGGQQIWIVSGLVSDDVARLRVFLGDGGQWDAPLRDNATAFRIQRAKFPVRLVAYDEADRIVGNQVIPNR